LAPRPQRYGIKDGLIDDTDAAVFDLVEPARSVLVVKHAHQDKPFQALRVVEHGVCCGPCLPR